MERYKLLCAKRVQTSFKLQHLIQKLTKMEYMIRACYQNHLSIDIETLAWMMAIDGLFLLEFFHIYVKKCTGVVTSSPARMSYLAAGKKLSYDDILKDMFMLENQIPIFVLNKILRVKCSSGEISDNLLPPLLLGVCDELSPLKLMDDYSFSEVIERAHLLDLLYHLMLPKAKLLNLMKQKDDCRITIEGDTDIVEIGKGVKTFSKIWKLFSKVKFLSKVNLGVVKTLKKVIYSRPMKLMLKLPLKVISKIPIVSAIAPMLEKFLLPGNEKKTDDDKKDDDDKPPLVEEIMIPTVTELNDVGVKFIPTDGDISTIKFDVRKRRLYLPVVHLDHNTEYVMRNLVAYEALAVSGPFVLARYTELMNGIIDTAEDAKLLREKKIIINRMKSDKQVAEFWNGMNISIKLTKVPFIDKVIQDVNVYYNNTQRVKFYRVMKVYVYGSWKMLIVLATILLMGLMMLQSFCSVYSCPRFFSIDDLASGH